MKVFRRIWNIFTSILIAIVVVFAVLLAGIRLFGFTPFTVLSGSMEPEIKTGSIVYVKEVQHEDVKVRDVITYALDEETLSTHRVVEILETEPHENNPTGIKYIVKGDANETEDPQPVMHSNVVGEVKFYIPYLGYAAEFILNPPGTYIAIAAGLLIVLIIFLPEILFGSEKSENEKKAKKGEENTSAKTAEEKAEDNTNAPSEETPSEDTADPADKN